MFELVLGVLKLRKGETFSEFKCKRQKMKRVHINFTGIGFPYHHSFNLYPYRGNPFPWYQKKKKKNSNEEKCNFLFQISGKENSKKNKRKKKRRKSLRFLLFVRTLFLHSVSRNTVGKKVETF